MADDFLKWLGGAAGTEEETGKGEQHYSIALGKVKQNIDLLAESRIEVRIPSHRLEVFARLVGLGGGMGKGFLWVPQVNDEVLVAFNQGDPMDAFVIGGVWSAFQPPPIADPARPLTSRLIQTGVLPGVGNSIEFDDALQSITIKTPLEDKIEVGPASINISTIAGHKIEVGPANINISTAAGRIKVLLDVASLTLTLSAPYVKIKGDLSVEISAPTVKVQGGATAEVTAPIVKIN